EILVRIFHPRGAVNHQARGFQIRSHFRELELQTLKFVEALSELLSLARIGKRTFKRAARHADHLRANPDAAFVKSFDRNFVATAYFSQHVFLRHKAFFQNQFSRRRGANTELVFFFTDGEAFEVLFYNEGGDAAITSFRIRVRDQHEDFRFLAVVDLELAAIHAKVIAAIDGTLLHRERISAGSS